jgi:hypothetical protein
MVLHLVGSFATGALIALFGAIETISVGRGAFASVTLVGLPNTIGVTGLVMGCAMMVQETRIAVRALADDRRYRHASLPIERVTPL